ncbi:hypothetical protein H634G_11163 [Metarhizium anisopliae BRIP 53293]|uniref:DNA/RNA-binding domain-containing protein n=1 Tax=Metarhizium anisopliae BRIP 53293 TaxID=1291518 RepID=A0A0D9NHV0_METAN|nr:hypothetical protein H634G_11163 [Metarhizium anisopliae BRIP 53293]
MALLYETVPAFEDTWIECLGDLGRYRMAVEDDDIRDREIWTGVSRFWYTKASDKIPMTGRLYHHLAILARPNALQQLYYYTKSLCVPVPFLSARDSVMTLFDPLLNANPSASQRLEPVDVAFVRVHGILFSGTHEDQLEPSMKQFLELLDNRIGREHGNWLESGDEATVTNSPRVIEEDINEGDQPSDNASRADAAEDEVNGNINKPNDGSIANSNSLSATECLPDGEHTRFSNTAVRSSSKYSIITRRLDSPACEKCGSIGQKLGEGGHVGGREGSSECSNGKLKRIYDRYESPPDEVPDHDPLSKRRRTAKRL